MNNIYRCNSCQKKFTFYRKYKWCSSCGLYLCKKCLRHYQSPDVLIWDYSKNNLCDKCYNKYSSPIEEKYLIAKDKFKDVEIYPNTYMGKKNIVESSTKDKIKTAYWRDKEDAMLSLKYSAAYIGCNVVFDVKSGWITKEDGNFVYKMFDYSGIPAVKK